MAIERKGRGRHSICHTFKVILSVNNKWIIALFNEQGFRKKQIQLFINKILLSETCNKKLSGPVLLFFTLKVSAELTLAVPDAEKLATSCMKQMNIKCNENKLYKLHTYT